MEGWRRWVRLVAALVVVLVLYFVLPLTDHPGRSDAVRLTLTAVLFALLTLGVVWQVRLQLVDQERHVDGLVLVLVLAIVAFAVVFYGIEQQRPEQIDGLETRLDSLYFTLTTLMTIGYGDIHAAGQLARGVVVVQIVFNVAVIATAATTINTRVRQKAMAQAQARAAAGEVESHPRLRRHRSDRTTHRKPT